MKNQIRSYVENSRKRCEARGLNIKSQFSLKILSQNEIAQKLTDNEDIIITAIPFIEQLYKFVKGSGFFVILTDYEGCILNVLGDEEILDEAFKLNMVPGAYMNEENIGTNAMSLAINEGAPVQISGDDHYIEAYHKWTCSAAPIKNSENKVISVLNLTGYCQNVHPHTLGMVVAAANAIERMLDNCNYNKPRKLQSKISSNQAIYRFDKIIGTDKRFLEIIDYAKKIASSRSTVLITGESGTGKEIFAQSIHNHSDRHDAPFIAMNCGAIPANLIESELFGYEEGAFTGAKKGGYIGKFEAANNGTIFLDEIGEMPLDMQVRLLRVIEENIVTKIGSSKQTPVNVRIIAATNKNLKEEVEKGNFRKDLYYRLNVLPITLPPLRDRKDDIPLLVNYYMWKISKKLVRDKILLTDDEMDILKNYSWPGNIRELENVVELILNTEAFPEALKTGEKQLSEIDYSSEIISLQELEKQHIKRVISKFDGNITKASKVLGIGRNTLYRKIKDWGIDCSILEQCSTLEQ